MLTPIKAEARFSQPRSKAQRKNDGEGRGFYDRVMSVTKEMLRASE